MGENIVIQDGIFCDGTSSAEIEVLKSLEDNKKVIVHMIIPGEAHITLYDN